MCIQLAGKTELFGVGESLGLLAPNFDLAKNGKGDAREDGDDRDDDEKFDQGEGALLRWFQTHNFNYYWLFTRIYQLKLGWQLFFKGILKRVGDGLAELFWANWLRRNKGK